MCPDLTKTHKQNCVNRENTSFQCLCAGSVSNMDSHGGKLCKNKQCLFLINTKLNEIHLVYFLTVSYHPNNILMRLTPHDIH